MPRRTTSRLADAARGLAALIALLALLIGVPLLLLRTGVLPAGITSWHDVTTALSLPDDGTLFLGALTLIGWAAWLSFVSSVVMEAGAVLRHRKAPRIRVLGATQRLASSLVAGVVLLLPASAAFAASPTTGAVSVSTTTGLHQTGATQAATAPATSSAQAWTGRIHQVRTGDTLWDLAEHYLGSGTRWHEIAGVNDGIRQSDGTLMTGNILDLQPGWLLRLPATAEAPATGEHLVVVQPGDTLSQIAQDELGDGNLFPKLLEATRDRVQPDGSHLTDPDRLLPGEVIVIPATATPDAPPLAAKPSPVVPAPTEAPPRPPAATPPSAPTAPPSTQPQAPSHAPSMANPQTDPGQTTPTSQAPDKADTTPPPAATGDDAAIPAQQTVAGIAAILGAALLSVIAWRRREQQRHRQPGETIAMPEETSQAEQALDRISSPASVELLDRALRTLAHQHPDALPVIRGAKVAAARVEIRVDDEDTEALSPFTDRPGGWWGLRADRASLLTAQQASTVPAPYPGLTTIGADTDGALLLAHLPFSGVLLLDGTDQQVREVARGIAMEAGTAVWADHIEVMTCGFGLELQELLPQSRVMFSPGLPAATEDLARVLIEAHQAEHEGGEPPQPWLLVCAVVPSAEELYAFADLMGKACGQRIAAVLPADGARDLFPDAEVLDAGSTEPQGLEVLETEVVLQRVTDEAYRQLTATMTTAVEPPVQAEGAWAHVPNPEERRFGPGAVGTTTASRSHLSLLAAPDEPEPTKETDAMTDAVADEEPAGPVAQPAQSEGTLPHNIPAADSAHNQAAPAGGPHTHHTLGKVSGSGLSRTDLSKTARVSIVRDNQPQPAPGKTAPQVQVLGPLRLTEIGPAPLAPALANLAAVLVFTNFRDYGTIANRMDSAKPWSPETMAQQMSRLRARLGLDSTGHPYLRPKPKGVEQYTLSEEVTVDWADFLHLSERGLPHGPAGILDLEAALALVRGRPFGEAGAHNWAAGLVQNMVSRIIDTAHTVAVLRTRDDILDVDSARDAIRLGLDVEPTAEALYRDWMRIEHRANNTSGVLTVVDQVRQMARSWDSPLQESTEELIRQLTTGRGAIKGL